MMKRQKSTLLAGLMLRMAWLEYRKVKAGDHDGVVTGLCAAGAASLGVAGAVAIG